jgi:Zn-dependent protease with chaperone function
MTRNLSILKNTDLKYDLLVIGCMFILSFALFSVLDLENGNNKFFSLLLISFISVLPVVVIYVFGPIRYLFKSKNYNFNQEYKKITKEHFKKPLNVIILNSEIANAYATGVLPFSRTIILNTGLDNKLTNDEITSLLYHEIGHHKKNHMLKLFLVNIVWSFCTISFFNYAIFPLRNEIAVFPLILSGYYGLVVTGGLLFIGGAFQKRFEYEADKFAVQNNKGPELETALTILHNTSKVPHNQWTLNYPSLNQRIARIKSYT